MTLPVAVHPHVAVAAPIPVAIGVDVALTVRLPAAVVPVVAVPVALHVDVTRALDLVVAGLPRPRVARPVVATVDVHVAGTLVVVDVGLRVLRHRLRVRDVGSAGGVARRSIAGRVATGSRRYREYDTQKLPHPPIMERPRAADK
jgi:hypothetical protein